MEGILCVCDSESPGQAVLCLTDICGSDPSVPGSPLAQLHHVYLWLPLLLVCPLPSLCPGLIK